jgi:hypothetical protein
MPPLRIPMPGDCSGNRAQLEHAVETLTGPRRHPASQGDPTDFINFINDSALSAGGCMLQITQTEKGLKLICTRPEGEPCPAPAERVAEALAEISVIPRPQERYF